MKNVPAIILSGGQGKRLFPLTMSRCKPAMYYGGRHRLIDIPISNAINSGCRRIYIITQFLSRSLHQHIIDAYPVNSFSSCRIDLLTVEERPNEKNWLQGTADAVRQNLDYIEETSGDYLLVLSGDQLYNMDYDDMLDVAKATDADVVIASLPVRASATSRLGILQIDKQNMITSFIEKPQNKADLVPMKLTKAQEKHLKIPTTDEGNYLGSMGIYLFKRNVLINLLKQDLREDFGKHIIPAKVRDGKVATYIHQGYWEDVGTIESLYYANMALISDSPPFNCYDEERAFFAQPTTLPGARLMNSHVDRSMICEGSIIDHCEIKHSILGPRTHVCKGTIIRDSYIMGNDFIADHQKKFLIGEDCVIEKALIDKNVRIGKGVKLINKEKLSYYDSENVYIRDGIIVVPRGATIPDNYTL